MNIKDVRQKNEAVLKKELAATRDELRELKFKLAKDETKNIRQSRDFKRTIARILTVLREREQEGGAVRKVRPLKQGSK